MKKRVDLLYKTLVVSIMLLLSLSASYAQEFMRLGKITHSSITEISGIVPYSYERGYFWVHNDSGDGPYIYSIDSLGNLLQKVTIKGIRPIDVEDIGRVSYKNENYLLLADIGNNLRNREILSLYLIKEPKIDNTHKEITVNLERHIQIKYADKRRDCEAVFIDPLDNRVYLVSKRDFESTVFSFSLLEENKGDEVIELHPLLTLPFTFTTAADISKDGKHILIKNLTTVYYWERKEGEKLTETLKRKPKQMPYKVEPQGEAICFDLDQRVYYTVSERPFGLDAFIYKYHY